MQVGCKKRGLPIGLSLEPIMARFVVFLITLIGFCSMVLTTSHHALEHHSARQVAHAASSKSASQPTVSDPECAICDAILVIPPIATGIVSVTCVESVETLDRMDLVVDHSTDPLFFASPRAPPLA